MIDQLCLHWFVYTGTLLARKGLWATVITSKKSNKVGVMSEEEEYAYRKMEEEIWKEEVDDIIQTKPLPWLMFAAKPNNPDYKAASDEANSSTMTEVVEKKGGVAFSIEYKSSVPKLPPINLSRALVPLVEDYEKWKGTC